MNSSSSIISLSSKSLANILELIKMMTGLQNLTEVNLKYNQILNNLQDKYYEHPKQLDVDRCVKAITEKYYVQGFPLEAQEFEMRVDRFINYTDINNHSKLPSDAVKWSIIAMIVNMAKNPCGSRNAFRKTNLVSVRTELEGESAVLNNSWKANLIQELLDIGRTTSYIESSSEMDSEAESDFDSLSNMSEFTTYDGSIIKDEGHPLSKREYLKLVFSNENTARNLLIKRASQFWWHSKCETIVYGGSNSPCFGLKRYSKNEMFKIVEDKFVILECLKNHLSSSYILEYTHKSQIQLFGYMTILSSVTPEVFNQWILTILPFIQNFNDLVKFTCHLKGIAKIPYTLRAYAKGLEKILNPIIEKMEYVENRIKNLGHYTILSFEEEMYKYFQIISYVHSVHLKALISNWETTDNWKTSIKLISVLFWSVQTAIIDYQKSVVMTLYLHAIEPYIHMTELWIHTGQVVDEYREFIISHYEGDISTRFSIDFEDVHGYLENCNLNVPSILEYLIYFLKNCDWKVFVASQINDDAIDLCEVPRGELFHNFLIEIKNSNNFLKDYITTFDEYNSANWNQTPLLASTCVNYKYTSESTFYLTIPSSSEMVDMFLFVIQKVINNIGLKVRDIVLKKNKFVYHLKNLYNILFLEEVNKSVSIDRNMEYKIERNIFLNNCFYSLLSDEHNSTLSSNYSCNLSLNYKAEKLNIFGETNLLKNNFADELENITITYDVKFPLSLILTNDIIFKYNKIFRLLITVKQAVEMISQLQTKDLNKYYSLDVKRMYFIRLWIMSTTYKLQTYLFSVASKYLGSKLFDSIEKVQNGLEAFQKVLEEHVFQATKLCMLDGMMEKMSSESLALLWNACEQFTKLWKKSITNDIIDIELMETIEQEYVDSCWKLASSLDTYLVAEDDTSSILFEFCRDFMSSMPTKESADLDGSLVYKLSDSQNRYSFTYM